MDVVNVIVVVSRWFGGIQLGPARFKWINNAARRVLEQEGFVDGKKLALDVDQDSKNEY